MAFWLWLVIVLSCGWAVWIAILGARQKNRELLDAWKRFFLVLVLLGILVSCLIFRGWVLVWLIVGFLSIPSLLEQTYDCAEKYIKHGKWRDVVFHRIMLARILLIPLIGLIVLVIVAISWVSDIENSR